MEKHRKVETVSKRSAVTHVLQTKSQVGASEFSVNHATDNITNGFPCATGNLSLYRQL